MIAIDIDPKIIFGSCISKGSYGEIFKFELADGKTYALKNIKVDS